MARFEWFVAFRYLRGAQGLPEGGRFLRFVLYAAVGGVAVGVAALLLALSIVRGFSVEIERKIIAFGAHVQVSSLLDEPITREALDPDTLRVFAGVQSVSPVVSEFVLLRRSARQIDGVSLWGTDSLPPLLREQVVQGDALLGADTSGLPPLVLGQSLAENLGAALGDRVTLFTLPERGALGQGGVPRAASFAVTGIYRTNLANFDELYVFTSLGVARRLLRLPEDGVTRYDLLLTDVSRADVVAETIETALGFPIVATSVFTLYRSLFSWVALQQNIVPLVLSVLVLVAAFSIVGILFMLVLEKSREIGIFVSMGASSRRVRRLYLAVGATIGLLGATIGAAFALVVGLLQQRFGFIPLPAEAYYIDRAPIALAPLDFVLVGSLAIVLCTVAAWLPARFAARLEPIAVLRF